MRKLVLTFSPLAAGLAPAADGLAAAWSFGPTAAFLAASGAGAVTFRSLARPHLNVAAQALAETGALGAQQDFAQDSIAPAA